MRSSPRTSVKDHERRIGKLEDRVSEIEQSYGDTQYQLLRRCVRTDLNVVKIMRQLNLDATSEDEVDEVLDAE